MLKEYDRARVIFTYGARPADPQLHVETIRNGTSVKYLMEIFKSVNDFIELLSNIDIENVMEASNSGRILDIMA